VGILEVSSLEGKGILEISFYDTGVGIPEDVKPKLFTPMMTKKLKVKAYACQWRSV